MKSIEQHPYHQVDDHEIPLHTPPPRPKERCFLLRPKVWTFIVILWALTLFIWQLLIFLVEGAWSSGAGPEFFDKFEAEEIALWFLGIGALLTLARLFGLRKLTLRIQGLGMLI